MYEEDDEQGDEGEITKKVGGRAIDVGLVG